MNWSGKLSGTFGSAGLWSPCRGGEEIMLKNYTGSDLRHLNYQAKPGWEGSLWENGYMYVYG